MQLTKDEIEEVFQSVANDDPEVHMRFAAAVIAAHTAKVLGNVEPVAYLYFSMSGRGERAMESLSFNPRDPACSGMTREDLCRAHTVAALKSERDTLAARVAKLEGAIDSVLLDIDEDGIAEAQDIVILAMRNIRNGRPQYEGLDAALAAKGQA